MRSAMERVRFIRSFGAENLYLNCIKRYGLQGRQISIPNRAFENSMSLIPVSELTLMYRELEIQTQDSNYVLHSMADMPIDKAKIISRWILSAQDLISCVRRFNGGVSSIHSGAMLQGSQVGNILKWTYDVKGIPSDMRVHDSIRFAIFMVKLIREYLGAEYRPMRVQLCGMRKDTSLYSAFFGCDVEWSHHRTEVWLNNDHQIYQLNRPIKSSASLAMTYSDLDSLLDMPNPDEEIKTIAELIKYARYYGFPTIDRVAGFMGLSSQQLQRKLNSLGGNFTVLSNYVFSHYAAEQLVKGVSPQQISESIGYSSVASFNRMFKKHRGVTPREYVQQRVL
ncbi:AraC family transcriptional regulator [Vibrio agarivorans]|uniref:AraC family transcriptional regulator n=1 Tax=Vibrio agarivorans TaxID=153622 RepID=UPI0025B363AC|nr:AraC family transcriptional regulator [Vibrio agarivorans]MDN3659918.1 helix-turn-helix domain-containing protein [Vibrio agarivorans]